MVQGNVVYENDSNLGMKKKRTSVSCFCFLVMLSKTSQHFGSVYILELLYNGRRDGFVVIGELRQQLYAI